MARRAYIAVLASLALCFGCAVRVGPEVQYRAELEQAAPQAIPEEDLLDVDIRPFAQLRESLETRMNALNAGDGILGFKVPTTRNLREAEGHYLGRGLAEKLEESGQWGRVRLNPYGISGADLEVAGRVLQSDGNSIRLHVEVRDSSGKLWLSRRYTQLSPSTVADDPLSDPVFPFPDVLNAIANDLVAARTRELAHIDATTLRQHSALKFAAELAPDVYASYLDDRGVRRLPAQNDPVFHHVEEMRLRNDAFLDAMQITYEAYVDGITRDYLRFLKQSSQITLTLTTRLPVESKISDSGTPAVFYGRGRYRSVYERAVADLSVPLEGAVAPLTLEFNDHTSQLSGTVEEQFLQWRDILREMYELDTGLQLPAGETRQP